MGKEVEMEERPLRIAISPNCHGALCGLRENASRWFRFRYYAAPQLLGPQDARPRAVSEQMHGRRRLLALLLRS